MSNVKKIILLCIGILFIFGGIYYKYQQPTFSIIIPVYNAENDLRRCLDSIMSQKGVFEVIAVNDESTDSSPQILAEYAKKYSNLKIVNQKNQGVSGARNTGIKAATKQYITFVDNDDWLEPNALKIATDIIKKDKPDILFAEMYDVYDREWVRALRGEEDANLVPEESKYATRALEKLALLSPFYRNEASSDIMYVSVGTRGQFFRKAFIDEHKINFPQGIYAYEDVMFLYRAYAANPLISIISTPLYDYHNKVDSLSKSTNYITKGRESWKYWQQTPEYKNADRRTKMQMEDNWLFLTILGMSNLQRHRYNPESYIDYVYNIYRDFSQKYSKEDLKNCRNYKKLQQILREMLPNLPL